MSRRPGSSGSKRVGLRTFTRFVDEIIWVGRWNRDCVRMIMTVNQLLKKIFAVSKMRRDGLHHDLDHLAGSWSADEAAEFDKDLAAQRKIDQELWR